MIIRSNLKKIQDFYRGIDIGVDSPKVKFFRCASSIF